MLSIIGFSVGIALCWFGLLRFSRTTKISLDDVDLPSEIVENKLTKDLLDELRDRDQGDVVDGIESEKEPSLSESTSNDSADPAETSSEVPSEVTKVEEPFSLRSLMTTTVSPSFKTCPFLIALMPSRLTILMVGMISTIEKLSLTLLWL